MSGDGQLLALAVVMKSTRAKIGSLLKQTRKSLKDAQRIHKKLRALRAHVKEEKAKRKKR